jgi:tripartite-type tricarboxylate transporter receptor subunit TctC
MNISRRSFTGLATAAVGLGPSAVLGAEPYPTRAVKIIVPFGAGGPADVYARAVAQQLSASLKQPFVIENRPGAGAIIGTNEAAKAEPDGYTLLMMSNTHTTNETLVRRKSYELLRDFVPVAPVNYSDLVVVVHPSVPATNLAELIALAKAEPGKLNYASSGIGTPYHMAGELLKAMTGTNIVHVPHRGSGEARNNVIGGHLQVMIDAVTTMAPNVEAGQVRALATTGQARSSVLPGVPTVAEAGVPGYEATIWLGIMAPRTTPTPIISALNASITAAVNAPETRAAWAKQAAAPMSMNPAEFQEYIRADIAKWAKVIEGAGIKPE